MKVWQVNSNKLLFYKDTISRFPVGFALVVLEGV